MLLCFRLSPSFLLIPFSLSCFFSFPDNLTAPPLVCGHVLVLGVGLGLFFGIPTTPTTADKDFERRDIPCLVFLRLAFLPPTSPTDPSLTLIGPGWKAIPCCVDWSGTRRYHRTFLRRAVRCGVAWCCLQFCPQCWRRVGR